MTFSDYEICKMYVAYCDECKKEDINPLNFIDYVTSLVRVDRFIDAILEDK